MMGCCRRAKGPDVSAGEQRTEAQEGGGARVLGLVADPDMPTLVGTRLAGDLTGWLGERTGHEWSVEVVSDPVTAARTDSTAILSAVERHIGERGWHLAICVTDLPLLMPGRALLADGSTQRGVAIASLPALGGLQPHRRMWQMLTQLLDDLLGTGGHHERASDQHRLASWLTDKLGPIHRTTPPGEDVDVRYTASARSGWLRLLSGMVRTNRPSQLIFGLSGALAAALASSAFGLSSTTIWMIGDRLGLVQKVPTALASVALLVGWLIAAHGLWERSGRRSSADSRRLVWLYNSSTVLTLVIGVGVLYVGLSAVNLLIALVLIPSDLLAQQLSHPANWSTYLGLTWGFTTMGVVAGALGSSLESDRAVRQAAYGYREEQRRAQQAEDQQ